MLWCLRWSDLFAPALHLAGLHPDWVIHVEAGSDANLLLAIEECVRHAGIAGVVGEVTKYSTTASKRLQLAAEGSGVTAFVFRRASKIEVAAALIGLFLLHIGVTATVMETLWTYMLFQALSMTCIGLCGLNFGAYDSIGAVELSKLVA